MADPAIIVGAGQAGAHAAAAMRRAGFADPILLVGDEAKRPYERPPLSKEWLTAAAEPAVSHFHPEAHDAENKIAFIGGTAATRIDPGARTVDLADGRSLRYGALLLATGGRARRLDVPGAERVLALRTLDDARSLRARLSPGARVVCVGAGVIGLEVASSARARGCAVTVVEAGPTVMGRSLPPGIAAWLADLHRGAGVRLIFGSGVAAVTPEAVILAEGTAVAADVVVAGIGMVRNTELAEAAGVALDGGIAVDAFGRTNLPDIYAAGDVAAFWSPRLGRRLRWETWRHAQDHGAAVGRAMAGAGEPYDAVPWFWTDQHGRSLQVAGDVAARPADGSCGPFVMRGRAGEASFSAWLLDETGAVTAVIGVDAPRDVRAGQALIRSRRVIDPAIVANPAVTPQQLAKL
ncbi:NAD(P)/FAD-dependent oxidoreductase [Methylobacterium mesophilicum]|uniref:NAD(P)/FAD-dependent oxidoreductase n=1 Tax=Methylobacterium mesophilicum TaxID=39956 RepID=UPI0002C605BA|nr:FAD-dependent oxidoreductase [Methylobacterium mesophilicum]